MDKVKGILKFAMRMEKDAHKFYSYYEDRVVSPQLRELFASLAEVEQKHYEMVKSQYDILGGDDTPKVISWSIGSDMAIKNPHILADNSQLLGEGEGGISDLMIIRMAYLIEKEFEGFYHNAIGKLDEPNARAVLQQLSDWEKRHREFFEEQYRGLLKKEWEDAETIIFG